MLCYSTEMSPNLISWCLIFKNFLRGHAPRPPSFSMLHKLMLYQRAFQPIPEPHNFTYSVPNQCFGASYATGRALQYSIISRGTGLLLQ